MQSRRQFFASLAGIAGMMTLRNRLAPVTYKWRTMQVPMRVDPHNKVFFRGMELVPDHCEVAVWNRALSDGEIQTILSERGRFYDE